MHYKYTKIYKEKIYKNPQEIGINDCTIMLEYNSRKEKEIHIIIVTLYK